VCLDPADFDDDGDLDQTDVVAILLFLSHGIDRSAPPGPFTCGPDPTHDDLAGECDGAGCS
jgi:hypothetical protein